MIEEIIKIENFKRESNNNPLLKKYGIKVVDVEDIYFWKYLVLIWTIVIFLLIGILIYNFSNSKFDGIVKPTFNNRVNNSIQINNTLYHENYLDNYNQFNQTIINYNNITIEVYLVNNDNETNN